MQDACESSAAAHSLWQQLGDRASDSNCLCWLSRMSWYAANNEDAWRYADLAIAEAGSLPPGRELATALSLRSALYTFKNEKQASAEKPGEKLGQKPAKAEAIKKDLEMLEGKYKMTAMEGEGRENPNADQLGLFIEGTDYFFLSNGLKNGGPSKIKIDPTTTPKSIDIISGRGTSLGIYQVTKDGDLVICVNQAQGAGSEKRPKKFSTKPGLDVGSIMYTLKKQPAEKDPVEEKPDKTLTKAEAIKQDLEKLKGKYKMTAIEGDGRDDPSPDQKGLLIDGTDYFFLINGSKEGGASKIKIDPTTSPRSIDVTSGNGTSKGIYRFKDGELQVCFNQPQGAGSDKRPKKFTTKPAVGAGSILYTLEKDKE